MTNPIFHRQGGFAIGRSPALRNLARLASLACALAALWLSSVSNSDAASPIIINSASFDSLVTALDSGGDVLLQFNGTITVDYPLEVFQDTILDGTSNNVTISGGTTNQIFHVEPGVTLTLINLTIANGGGTGAAGAIGTTGVDGAFNGGNGGNGGPGGVGGDAGGGAIFNDGNLLLYSCVLSGNAIAGGAGGAGGGGGNGDRKAGSGGNGGNGGSGMGGAVYNTGFLFMTNCSVAGNTAAGGAGGVGGTNGAGVSAFSGAGGVGQMGAGAGVYNLGTAVIANSTFNQNSSQGGTTQAAGSQPQGSGAGQNGLAGGGAFGAGFFSSGSSAIVNSTFWRNSVTGGTGGTGGPSNGARNGGNGGNGGSAIGGNIYNAASGTISVTNCTIISGSALGGTGGAAGGTPQGITGSTGISSGANIANNAGTFQFKNSLLSFPTNALSASGTIIDLGNNLSSDATPAFTTTNSFDNRDPKVFSTQPASHGGPTLTVLLQSNSPAIDAIYDNSAPPVDQRGFARPIGVRSDIGAIEFGAVSNNFTLSGTVMVGSIPFPGVTVKIGNASVTSDSSGNYSAFLPGNLGYTVAPQPQGYFSPASAAISLNSDMPNVNFVATNAPTVLSRITTNTNQIQITFSAVPTFTYRIQAATNLSSTNTPSTNWVTIATNTATNASIIYLDSLTNFPRRFYRAVITP